MFRRLFGKAIPALILTRSLEPFPELMEMAVKHQADHPAQQGGHLPVHPQLHRLAQGQTVPRITRHGVLVDVYGEGVLLMGESGVARARPPWSW